VYLPPSFSRKENLPTLRGLECLSATGLKEALSACQSSRLTWFPFPMCSGVLVARQTSFRSRTKESEMDRHDPCDVDSRTPGRVVGASNCTVLYIRAHLFPLQEVRRSAQTPVINGTCGMRSRKTSKRVKVVWSLLQGRPCLHCAASTLTGDMQMLCAKDAAQRPY